MDSRTKRDRRAPSSLSPLLMEILGRSALGLGHCRAMVRKRKIIVYIAASADGFIARTDGSVDLRRWKRPTAKALKLGTLAGSRVYSIMVQ